MSGGMSAAGARVRIKGRKGSVIRFLMISVSMSSKADPVISLLYQLEHLSCATAQPQPLGTCGMFPPVVQVQQVLVM